jgi:hypothetical protein
MGQKNAKGKVNISNADGRIRLRWRSQKNELLTNACPFRCFFKHLLCTVGHDAFFLISQHQQKETGDKIICRLFFEKEIAFSVTYFV